jgi:hypothetical protein
MNSKHCHVKCKRDNDEAEDSSNHMLSEDALYLLAGLLDGGQRTYRSDGLDVAQENPQLQNSQASNPSNCE